MTNLLKQFLAEESGPTIVEYALMLVLVAIAVAVAAPNITTAILAVFSQIAGLLNP
jgi:Flp pilus assembly pilin Flp